MKAVTFCRTLFLVTTFLFLKGYGDITSYQTKKQGETSSIKKELSLASKTTSSQETKCPSGGCFAGAPTLEDYPLLVFISFSMPEASLLSFAKELEVYGGAFVMRGLPNNSFAEFFNKLNHLKEIGMDAPILIDPDRFEAYEVVQVPTIILRGENTFDKMVGNIPVSDALEIFAEKGEERWSAKELQRLSLYLLGSYFPKLALSTPENEVFRRENFRNTPELHMEIGDFRFEPFTSKQNAHHKHCMLSHPDIQTKQGIQNSRGIQ